MENYADVMEDGIKALEEQGVLARLADLGIDTQYFNQSVFEFRIAAQEFDFVSKENLTETQTRVINDQMRGFERTFLLYDGRESSHYILLHLTLLCPGLPDRIQYRHVVSAPSLFDAYGGSAFPGLGDLLYKLDQVKR